MNFFKKGKYKLGGKASNHKGSEKVAPKEYFYKVDGPSTSRNGNHVKDTTSVVQPINPVSKSEFCFRFVNQTALVWKQKNLATENLPEEISPNENKVIKLSQFQSEIEATYVTDVSFGEDDAKTYEFQLIFAKDENKCLLTVDWMNLIELQDVQLKPDLASDKEPICLNNDETTVEISISAI